MKKEIARAQGAQTKCVHAPREFNRISAISPPIWQTTTFLAESSQHFATLAKSVKPSEYYSRYGNPTHNQVEATSYAAVIRQPSASLHPSSWDLTPRASVESRRCWSIPRRCGVTR